MVPVSAVSEKRSLFLGDGVGSEFATSMALSGDGTTMVVGSPGYADNGNENAGGAFVYEYDTQTGTWTQPTMSITNGNVSVGSRAGTSVAISENGEYIIVGVPES